MRRHSPLRYGLFFVSLFFVAYCSYLHIQQPKLNHDILRYGAVALEYDGYSPEEAHQEIYKRYGEELGHQKFTTLTEFNPKAKLYKENPSSFVESMEFFRVKPLYTAMVYMAHKMGIPLSKATYYISVLFYFLTCLFIYYWLTVEKIDAWTVALIACITSLIKPMLAISSLSGPDTLSVFLLTLSFFAILREKESYLIITLLLLSCLARPDNALFAICYFSYNILLQFREKSSRHIWRPMALVFLFGTLMIVIPLIAGNEMSWMQKFKHLESGNTYAKELKNSLHHFIRNSSIPKFFCLALLAYPLGHQKAKNLLIVLALTFCSRSILFPSFQGRFYVAYVVLLIVLSVIGTHRWLEKNHHIQH